MRNRPDGLLFIMLPQRLQTSLLLRNHPQNNNVSHINSASPIVSHLAVLSSHLPVSRPGLEVAGVALRVSYLTEIQKHSGPES